MRKEVVYIVNEEKGVVVCKILNCTVDAVLLLDKNGLVCMDLWPQDRVPTVLVMQDTYTGIAKLKDGDTFNEEFGKKLAYKIAMAKYNAALDKKITIAQANHKKYVQREFDTYDKLKAYTKQRSDKAAASLSEIVTKEEE